MNNFSLLAGAIPAVFLVAISCSREMPFTEPVDNLSSEKTISISLPDQSNVMTRTFLDITSGATFPVYWSDGDAVSVNGVKSSPLSIPEGAKVSKAEFQVTNIEPPYQVIYPDSSYLGNDDEGYVELMIPSVQDYRPDSFGCGSAIMFGSSDSEGGIVGLHNLCGAICATLKNDSSVIMSASLTSLGSAPIAGQFKLNASSGELTEVSGTRTSCLAIPEGGITLSTNGTRFFFTVPAGKYPDGFCLRFDDGTRHIQRNYWLRPAKGMPAGIDISAGELVMFDALEYDPDAREITSEQDWDEFVEAYKAGVWEDDWLGKDGSIKVGADFSVSSSSSIEDFSYILDGCGHEITFIDATSPLIKNLSGTIRNLTISGTSTAQSVFSESICENATIEKCINKASISVPEFNDHVSAAPFASSMTGGSIVNCTNMGSVFIQGRLENSYRISAGGIVAIMPTLASCAEISGCHNLGTVTVNVTKPAGVATYPGICGIGGIAGAVLEGTEEKHCIIKDCTNDATIAVDYIFEDSSVAASASGAGGIVGVAAKYDSSFKSLAITDKSKDCICLEISGCTTAGHVSNSCCSAISSFLPSKSFAGGIAGILAGQKANHIIVKDCHVTATILGHVGTYSRSALSTVTGGLAGYAGYVDFSGCEVLGSQIGSLERQSYSSAGAIGLAMTSFKMSNCRIYADVIFIRNYLSSDPDKDRGNYSMGFALSTKLEAYGGIRASYVDLTGSEVSNCGFGGAITFSTDIIAYNSATPSVTQTTVLSESNFTDHIASGSFYVNGVTGKDVTFANNYYWNGE